MNKSKSPRDKYYEDFLSANPSFKDIVNVLSFDNSNQRWFDNRTIADQRFDPKKLEVIDTLNSSIHVVKSCRYDRSLNFEFAVKYIPILQDRFGTNDEVNKKKLDNLLKELKGFKNLINHESIVKFYGLCFDKEQVLVCMELMDFSLREFYTTFHQANKPFPEDLVGYIVKFTVQALQACQAQGLNHRMIKPSNIFFNRVKGEIKLGDYGEARILHDSMASTFSGTLCYWAPERFSLDYKHDDSIYNIGCNVWSLGITLIEIILGKLPYKDRKGRLTENIVLLKQQIGELQTSNLDDHLGQKSIADSVKGFIQKCLVTSIEERTYDMIAGTEFYKSIKKPYNEVVKKYVKQYESEKEAHEKRLEQDLLRSKVEPKTPDSDPKKVFEQETFSFNVANVKEGKKIYTQRRSEIFEGIYELDDRKLAIKKLLFKSHENPLKKKNRFIYEIQVIKKLNNKSPFITYFYEYEVKDTQGNLYMELMNMNLKELYLAVHRSVEKFPEQLLRCITVSTVNALSYFHEKNIIHCDVKPTNVLINQHGKIKLTDFDSAIDIDNTKGYDRIGGTMAYWAPDLLLIDDDFNSKSSEVDQKTQARFNPKRDIWSLGMTLAEALIGRLPYLQEGEDPPKGYDVIKYVNKIDYARVFLKRGHSFEEFLDCSDFYGQFAADRDYDISIIRFLSACLQFMANIPSLIELQEEDFYRACPKDNDEIYRIAKEQLESLKVCFRYKISKPKIPRN
uniref:mitogen-activated protein kinase kinase n=1 Tax=Acrobeloides nanus TaxID=290746 RepID=A0A914DK45_9BILA